MAIESRNALQLKQKSLNHLISSKNPKSKHYVASESVSCRIGAAACQKNDGVSYIFKVFEKLGYSPGRETKKFRNKKDNIRFKNATYKQIIRKRRNKLKKIRSKKSAITKRKEGITYKTGVALDDVTQLLPKILSDSKNKKIENVGDVYKIVIFYQETTGLFENDEIYQFTAYYDDDSLFNTYILPGKPVSKNAFLVTGLQVIDGGLYLHDKPVKALVAKTAVIMILNFCKDLKSSIILIAHNGFRFDVPRIIDLVMHCGLMDEFKQYVKGFADSLVLIRNLLPERRKQKKKFSVGL